MSWSEVFAAAGLCLTTVLSWLLLASSLKHWTFDPATYRWITSNRATTQLLLQLLSNALALIHVTILGGLINRATRIYWKHRSVDLDLVRFWHTLCVRSINWNLPIHLILPLVFYILITAAPSALWAGALTPVSATTASNGTISIPNYQNTSNIKEWPSEIGSEGPILRSPKGLFVYSVGVQMQGSLLTSALSGTSVDGSPRQHGKLDNSGFTYFGRSFGVGASVGLMDDELLNDDLVSAYSYEEVGYEATVTCMYNASSQFVIVPDGDSWFEARGLLPNSGDAGPEDSSYPGHGPDSILAIGVGRNPQDPRRMLAIAAGSSYLNLNATQCSIDFQPTLFNIIVGVTEQNITVNPISKVDSFEDGGNLTQTVTRQFELISNVQTNLYVSVVGNSLNGSISDFIIAHNGSTPLSLEDATLRGLENALQVMLDDMLVAYASAQIMIQQDVRSTDSIVTFKALRVGGNIYIYAICAMNVVVIMLVAFEGVRTRGWRDVAQLNYLDPGTLMVTNFQDIPQPSTHEGTRMLIENSCEKYDSRTRLT